MPEIFAAVPVMAIMMLVAGNPRVMGPFTIGGGLRAVGWVATVVMATAAVAMALTSV